MHQLNIKFQSKFLVFFLILLIIFSLADFSPSFSQKVFYWLKEGAYVQYKYYILPHPNQKTLLFTISVYDFLNFVPNPYEFIPKNLSENEVLFIFAFNGSLIYKWEVLKVMDNRVILKITLSVIKGVIQTFGSLFYNLTGNVLKNETIYDNNINEKNILSLTVNIEVDLQTLDFYYNGTNYKRFMYWAFKEEFNNKTILKYKKDDNNPNDFDGYISVIGPLSSYGVNKEIKFKDYIFTSDRLAGSPCDISPSCMGFINDKTREMTVLGAKAYYYDMSTGILLEYIHKGTLHSYDTLQKRILKLDIRFTHFLMIIDDSNIDFSIPQLGGEGKENYSWLIVPLIMVTTISIGILLLAIKKYKK